MNKLERADRLLVSQGLVKSRSLAQKLIREGAVDTGVYGQWHLVEKVSLLLPADAQLRIRQSENLRFVSRAGLKLDHALNEATFDVQGCKVLDVGQSTGGFTDCVLQRDCKEVVGVDVGHDQLDDVIRNNPKVKCIEGLNAKGLDIDLVGGDFDLIVMDVSFISQTRILPKLKPLLRPQGTLISLVKPQFEVGPEGIGKGGIVKNVDLLQEVETKTCRVLNQLGFSVVKYFDSPIAGGDGNKEFFVVAKKEL